MTEIHFVVEESPVGGCLARAVGAEIFAEAHDLAALHSQVRDAVHCHFEAEDRPDSRRPHIAREEAIAA